ncbi:Sorting assembly machinery 50 kDa subunit [Nakaseomyces bracarensis]|uniref:Sorting assembly machinery 50 kDa subunit n=1 Tax=Nakaseomyces bracarensis TaxID=273131 RepID=A0ABR4NMU2_9SACH
MDATSEELEAQIQKFQDFQNGLLNKNLDTPISVVGVVSNGTETIKSHTLQKYLDDTILQATTLKQLVKNADLLSTKLVQHGLAQDVYQNFSSYAQLEAPSSDNPIPVIDVVSQLNILPVKKLIAKTGTNVGNNEGEGYLEFQLKNIFGNGESLKLDILKGTAKNSSILASFVKPVNPFHVVDMNIYKNSRNLGDLCPLDLSFNGGRMSVKSELGNNAQRINQEWFYEAVTRTTKVTSDTASDSLLYQAGTDFKSSIGHSFAIDNRDSIMAPNRGNLLKLNNEVALGKYWKSQFELNKVSSWFKHDFITLSTTLKGGYIGNFHPGEKDLHINDKYMNGGPNDIRSFQSFGVGPKDLHDAIGGDTFLSYGISLFSRLPIKKISDSHFRLHWFFNGGKLINHQNKSAMDTFNALCQEHSTSVGMGIVLRHPVARFELNFSLPVTASTNDSLRKGFQFGLGMTFL